LSAAIRLKQLAAEAGREVSVVVLEKGSEVGAHILSGAVMDPRALTELFPNWKELGAPLNQPVTEDRFFFLTNEQKALRLPNFMLPKTLHNEGNYIVSLGNVSRWLAQQAEALGVEIFPGFAAADIVYDEAKKTVLGVITDDKGRAKDGSEKPDFQPGMALHGKYTLFAEGCRGHLGKRLISHFHLDEGRDPQSYSIGIKELWDIDPAKHKPGLVMHTAGWPVSNDVYGGSFLYHAENNQVAIGFVVGLGYANPFLNPFEEFQRYKHHPEVAQYLEGGRRVAYGARAIVTGGVQALPKLVFPGGALIGDDAGFLNVPKIKGSHAAIKTGMLGAEAVFAALGEGRQHDALAAYPKAFESSWLYDELYRARNFKPWMNKGLIVGTLMAGLDQKLFGGRAPWTLHAHKTDAQKTRPASGFKRIDYPKPDGKLSFDRLSSVFLSNTNHEENQPCHLTLKDPKVPIAVNLAVYDAPEQRYCPAGVYEIVREGDGSNPRLQINAQNCVHCKTCDIKDPTQNIVWVNPEGGGGPNYPNM
jgi:electron-transferring-flavoprotein dehydrogenase